MIKDYDEEVVMIQKKKRLDKPHKMKRNSPPPSTVVPLALPWCLYPDPVLSVYECYFLFSLSLVIWNYIPR